MATKKINFLFDKEEEEIITEVFPAFRIPYYSNKVRVVVNHAGNIHMKVIYSDNLECNIISIVAIPIGSALPIIISEPLLIRYSEINDVRDISLTNLQYMNRAIDENIQTFFTMEFFKAQCWF